MVRPQESGKIVVEKEGHILNDLIVSTGVMAIDLNTGDIYLQTIMYFHEILKIKKKTQVTVLI